MLLTIFYYMLRPQQQVFCNTATLGLAYHNSNRWIQQQQVKADLVLWFILWYSKITPDNGLDVRLAKYLIFLFKKMIEATFDSTEDSTNHYLMMIQSYL